jgi:hypothetical protein
MIHVTHHLINGVAVGAELVAGNEAYLPSLVVDLLVWRVIFSYEANPDLPA